MEHLFESAVRLCLAALMSGSSRYTAMLLFFFFNYILLLPRSSAVMSNVCLCLNYNHLPAFSFCFSPVLPLSSLFTSLACSKTIFLRVRDKIGDASSKTGNVAG